MPRTLPWIVPAVLAFATGSVAATDADKCTSAKETAAGRRTKPLETTNAAKTRKCLTLLDTSHSPVPLAYWGRSPPLVVHLTTWRNLHKRVSDVVRQQPSSGR